ncbi:MAG: pantothenate kinase [Defluviitaleaceae bacterium]|nr:pantothenate kinase [Defluviitaleaceae bacterium]MCL2262090.1 pantothenate kinase [Defluviitaleaceae bacterium]
MVLGIDVGGSTTKIVGFCKGECAGMLQVEAGDSVTSAFGAFGKFCAEYSVRMGDIEKIMVTGVGAAGLEKGMYDIPTTRVDEFMAIGIGGLKLAALSDAFIISAGTGTALVKASASEIKHLGGSGVGGGMLLNLCERFAGVHSYAGITDIAKNGDLSAIDLRLCDISREKIGNLPPDTTVSNFGNLRDNAKPADFVLGFMNMIFESVGMMAIFATLGSDVKDIVLIGALSGAEHAAVVFQNLAKIHHVKFHIPKDAIFATAVGAALS